jgi:hypothetical protein
LVIKNDLNQTSGRIHDEGGNTERHDCDNGSLAEAEFPKTEAEGFFPRKKGQSENGGRRLRNCGSKRSPFHAQPQGIDEHGIKNDV